MILVYYNVLKGKTNRYLEETTGIRGPSYEYKVDLCTFFYIRKSIDSKMLARRNPFKIHGAHVRVEHITVCHQMVLWEKSYVAYM